MTFGDGVEVAGVVRDGVAGDIVAGRGVGVLGGIRIFGPGVVGSGIFEV